MNKSVLILVVAFLLVFAIVFGYEKVSDNSVSEVCITQNCFMVEVADDGEERSIGLMFRESLEGDRGMLFVFDVSSEHSFWMKNTLIALDMIWINEGKEVVFIKEGAQPCEVENCPSYSPESDALYVLEINSGKVSELGISVGDLVEFD